MSKKKKQATAPNSPTAPQPKQPILTKPQQSSLGERKSLIIPQNIAYILLALAVLAAFFGGFSNDFVIWDDPMYVSENGLILKPVWVSLTYLLITECALNYHPITMLTLWLNSFLFGQGPASFIITNTLIHLINTLLVYRFSLRLATKSAAANASFIAFFVALIWGVHPMHVESVTWISERKDVLYTCFFLLSCLQYLNFLDTDAKNNKYLIYTFLFFVLSCLSKGMAVVLPLVLLLLDYWYDRNWFSTKNIIQKIPFFVVAALFGALAIHVQGGGNLGGLLHKLTLDTAISNVFSIGQKLSFGFYGFLVYILKFFLPINQHNFYAYPLEQNYSDLQYVTAPLWAGLILAGAVLCYRRKKEVFFGILFFFFTVVLVLQFLSVGGAILAERYTYLPYFGLSFMVIYWLANRFSQTSLAAVLGLVSLVFIYLAYQQTLTYKTTETLFMNSYKYEKESAVVAENLANFNGKKGDYQKTIQYGEFALAKGVNSYGLFSALANAYYLSGNFEKSKEFYDKAVANTPEYRRGTVYYNKGIMNKAAGNYDQAVADFTNAIKTDSSTIKLCLGQKAYSLLLAKRYQESIADYTKMISMGMSVDTAYNNRAVNRFSLGDREGAISDLKEVMKINPNYADAKNNLEKLGVK